MSSFSYSIKTALVLFPIVALIFTLPYIFYQYHKYGSIHPVRSIILYSFLLYLMSAYFLVILPLPSIESVSKMTIPSYNFQPFHFVSEILHKTNFHVSDFATYFPTMKNPAFYEAFFNILLTLPFGVYLHYYFKCDFKHTFFYSFCFSLFFELTQITGLYFIYPRSYRVFDVDDLILNTTGGIVGYVVAFLPIHFMPTRDEMDKKSFENGSRVSVLRRSLSFLLDLFVYGVLCFCFVYLLKSYSFISKPLFLSILVVVMLLYFVILPVFLKNKTLGMKFFRLEFHSPFFHLKWYHYFRYYFLFALEFILLPILFLFLGYLGVHYHFIDVVVWEYYDIVVLSFTLMLYVISFLKRLFHMRFLYEKFSKMSICSSIGSSYS